MKKKRRSLSGTVIVALVVTAATVFLVRHFHVKNFHIVKAGILYTSGQPRGMDYTRLLYKYHIGTIVNVRSAAEHRERNWHNEEITWVRSNGVKYFEMPIDRDIDSPGYFPGSQVQERFLAIMGQKENLPVLLHGSSGRRRVAMLTAVWLIRGQGLSFEQAVKVAEEIKGHPLTEDESLFVRNLSPFAAR